MSTNSETEAKLLAIWEKAWDDADVSVDLPAKDFTEACDRAALRGVAAAAWEEGVRAVTIGLNGNGQLTCHAAANPYRYALVVEPPDQN